MASVGPTPVAESSETEARALQAGAEVLPPEDSRYLTVKISPRASNTIRFPVDEMSKLRTYLSGLT